MSGRFTEGWSRVRNAENPRLSTYALEVLPSTRNGNSDLHFLESLNRILGQTSSEADANWGEELDAEVSEIFSDALHCHCRKSSDEKEEVSTYALLIRWCGNTKAVSRGRQLHAHISRNKRDREVFLANLLLQMYGKCRSLESAWAVFRSISERDIFSWNFMIAAYAHNGHPREALRLYQSMSPQGFKPDKFTFVSALSATANIITLKEGRWIHSHILAYGLDSDITLKNTLLNMYGKCGSLKEALAIFNLIYPRSVISWTSMIVAYTQNGHSKEALELFRQMNMGEDVKPDRITYISILNACANLRSLEDGRTIHDCIRVNRLESDMAIQNSLLIMYGKCGSPTDSEAIFEKMRIRNVVSWTSMIIAYVENGCGKEALELYYEMNAEGILPNRVTFLSIIDACALTESLEDSKRVHEDVLASGFRSDMAVQNALLHMYGKCGSLMDALLIFDEMQERSGVSWNAMIAAYAQKGHRKEALDLFHCMVLEKVEPDKVTFLSVLNACTGSESLASVKMIHECIVASGLELDTSVRNSLLNTYGKCGSLEDAEDVFDATQKRNIISWNSMITAYTLNGFANKALERFPEMVLDGISPDKITFLSMLNACACLSSLENGRDIHKSILANSFQADDAIANALVNMYAKCGSLKEARTIFDQMHSRNTISWNAIITAYAQTGLNKEALELFRQMGLDGARPDRITFLSILNACSHGGLRDEGWFYLVSMIYEYGITPLEEHFLSIIDLLGRAGCLEEAEDLIKNMSVRCYEVAWNTMLNASWIHVNVERGTHAANHLFGLNKKNRTAPYMLLSEIFDVGNLKKAMEKIGMEEVKHNNANTWYPRSLWRFMKKVKEEGCIFNTKAVLHYVEVEREYLSLSWLVASDNEQVPSIVLAHFDPNLVFAFVCLHYLNPLIERPVQLSVIKHEKRKKV